MWIVSIKIIGGIAVFYAILKYFRNFASKVLEGDKVIEPKVIKPEVGPIIQPPPRPDLNDRFNLSILNTFLGNFDLPKDDSRSFFQLLTKMKSYGKSYFYNAIKNKIESTKNLAEIHDFYNSLRTFETNLDIILDDEVATSPVILKSSIQVYLDEYNLNDKANTNLKGALLDLLNAVFNQGLKKAISDFEVNFKWLGEYASSGDTLKAENTIKSILEKIDEEKYFL